MFCLRNVSPTLDHLFTLCSPSERAFITTVSHQIYGIISRQEIASVKGQCYIKVNIPIFHEQGVFKKATYGIKVNPDIVLVAQQSLFSQDAHKEFAHLIQCCLLTHACFTNHIKLAEHILRGNEVSLDRCLGVEKKFHEWRSLLQGTCDFGHVEIVKLLLKTDIEVNAIGSELPSLGLACFSKSPNKIEIVNLLLEAGANPNACWEGGVRLLDCVVFFAVKINKDPSMIPIVEKLLAAGADPNHNNFYPFEKFGKTLLENVCYPGMSMPSLIQQLIWSGAKGSSENAEFSGFNKIFSEAAAQRKAVLESYRTESEALDKQGIIRVIPHDIRVDVQEDPRITLAKSVIYRRTAWNMVNDLLRIEALIKIPRDIFGIIGSFCNFTALELNIKIQGEVLSKCKHKFMVL